MQGGAPIRTLHAYYMNYTMKFLSGKGQILIFPLHFSENGVYWMKRFHM